VKQAVTTGRSGAIGLGLARSCLEPGGWGSTGAGSAEGTTPAVEKPLLGDWR